MTTPMTGRAPLIGHDSSSCAECWGCARYCPVRAIRVVDGHAEIIAEKCVACGLCVNECARGGHTVRDDTDDVRMLLHAKRPVIAMLASEFIAALHPMTIPQIERGLASLGFHAVETTLLGEEIVAAEYERLHARGHALFTLRSTCPVAVDFVRKYHPGFVSALAPVVPPYVAQARLVRELYDQEIAIVYVSPCYARKDEALAPSLEGVVDAAIDFSELKAMLSRTTDVPAAARTTLPATRRPGLLKEVSLTDGFPRQTLAERDMTDASVHVVRGIPEIDRLLRAMTAGEVAPRIIDMLNCEGCIDGPAVNPGLSLYAKRTIDAAARHTPGTTRVGTRAMLDVLPSVETIRSFSPEPVVVPLPTGAEVDTVLAAGGFTRETALDCGACGWTTCVEHAIAIHRAESSWDLCFPLQRSRMREVEAVAAATVTLDELTGLWNQRSFSDRLDIEMARHARYGSALSMALVDIDDFRSVGDRFGDEVADAVLVGVAERIAGLLRSTDLAARWTGDQFALLLPGIGKTAAFAVAEKLRQALRESAIEVESGGYTHVVEVTLSAGVASAAPTTTDPLDLVEGADTALHEAMAAGKDQVRLAPG